MKLIIQNNKIAGIATDAYTGPEFSIAAPSSFDESKISDYVYEAGELLYPASEVNVLKAKALLLDSDWSDLPSVRNTAIELHLTNGLEFDAYRVNLRTIVVNKPAVVEVWPVCPKAAWSV